MMHKLPIQEQRVAALPTASALLCYCVMAAHLALSVCLSGGFLLKCLLYSCSFRTSDASDNNNNKHSNKNEEEAISIFSTECFLVILYFTLHGSALWCLRDATRRIRLMIASALMLALSIMYVIFYFSAVISTHVTNSDGVGVDEAGDNGAAYASPSQLHMLHDADTAGDHHHNLVCSENALLDSAAENPLGFMDFLWIVLETLADIFMSMLSNPQGSGGDHDAAGGWRTSSGGGGSAPYPFASIRRLDMAVFHVVGLGLGAWGIALFDGPPSQKNTTPLTVVALQHHRQRMYNLQRLEARDRANERAKGGSSCTTLSEDVADYALRKKRD